MEIESLIKEAEEKLTKEFKEIDELTYLNSKKVLDAFHKYNISEVHFNGTTGYGYGDMGRDAIESVFKEVLGCEEVLVRNQFISGTHALTVALFSLLRPNDTMMSITGTPYDTLKKVIGIIPNSSSLSSYGINYEEVDLIDDDFNYEQIEEKLKAKHYKLIHIQRSRGYSERKSIDIDKLSKVIKFIKNIDKNVIILVDNCYCEMCSEKEPSEIGADVIVGSLIKNLGGGVAPNGAYIGGKKEYVDLAAERLTVPGCGSEVGPSLGINKEFLKGLYMAPSAISASLKLNLLAAYILEKLGYTVSPKYNEKRPDIVLMITFKDEDKLIKFVQGIQMGSAIDANAIVEATPMPGYEHKIIMASGSFIQGSSIEVSCDGPLKPPYNAYLQGSLTYDYAKLALSKALERLLEK